MNEIDTLARTIWGEARGEGIAGMEAVAAVIMNRVRADLGNDNKPDWWGEGVEDVCRKPFQFSCWNEGDPNRDKLLAVTEQDQQFRYAMTVAEQAKYNDLPDPTHGATHYCAADVADKTVWAKGREPTVKIGRHWFYKL